jgi:hypothetical protein
MAIISLLNPEDWKRGIAMVILWAYAYALIVWPFLFWVTTLLTMLTGMQWPGPPLIPWEHLTTGTVTLGTVGGIQAWREKGTPSA